MNCKPHPPKPRVQLIRRLGRLSKGLKILEIRKFLFCANIVFVFKVS